VGERVSSRSNGRTSRKAFLSATGSLLRRQGYAATGLSEIVDRSGAPRGSLYFHFPGGKEELAIAAMERSGEALRRGIAATMAAPGGTAEGVAMLIDALAAGLEDSGYADGCPIATVALETAAGSEPLRATAAGIFAAWLAELERALLGEGLGRGAAERRATLVLAAIEGGLLLSRARRDTAPLRAVRDELARLLSESWEERGVSGSELARQSKRKEPQMPPRGVKKGSKRGKQYEHIKDSEKKQGRSTKRAEEIAARTVNKERARSGESEASSRSSTRGSSASSRGGKRSGKAGPRGRTREQLYNEAKQLGVEGRSGMNKSQLQRAVDAKKS
jgi:TetR/AcrR family transcriptional repressor of lmrAB and yxaGH operons